MTDTYDHRTLRTVLPVRSAILKQGTGGLVAMWETNSESPTVVCFWLSFCTLYVTAEFCFVNLFAVWGLYDGYLVLGSLLAVFVSFRSIM
jgi:hypothetical protein